MRIICEFCGSAVDINEDDYCPACGASYADNDDYQKRKKLELEKEQFELQKKKNTYNKRQYASKKKAEEKRRQKATATWMITIVVLFFMLPFLLGVVLGIYEVITGNNLFPENVENEYTEPEYTESENEERYQGSGKFDEAISNGVYTVTVDEIKECNREYYTPKNGYMFVEVHFVITNVYNEDIQLWDRRVDCIVNGFVQERCWDSNYHEITTDYIRPGLSIDGWEIFEIPINAQTIEIKYGDYININIDPKNIERLHTEE